MNLWSTTFGQKSPDENLGAKNKKTCHPAWQYFFRKNVVVLPNCRLDWRMDFSYNFERVFLDQLFFVDWLQIKHGSLREYEHFLWVAGKYLFECE